MKKSKYAWKNYGLSMIFNKKVLESKFFKKWLWWGCYKRKKMLDTMLKQLFGEYNDKQ